MNSGTYLKLVNGHFTYFVITIMDYLVDLEVGNLGPLTFLNVGSRSSSQCPKAHI